MQLLHKDSSQWLHLSTSQSPNLHPWYRCTRIRHNLITGGEPAFYHAMHEPQNGIMENIVVKSRSPTLHIRRGLWCVGRSRNFTIVRFAGSPSTPPRGRMWRERHSGQRILNEGLFLSGGFVNRYHDQIYWWEGQGYSASPVSALHEVTAAHYLFFLLLMFCSVYYSGSPVPFFKASHVIIAIIVPFVENASSLPYMVTAH